MNQAWSNGRLVPRKYDFIIGKYTQSNDGRSVEYGWWIARLNPNKSISSNVFLLAWYVRCPGAIQCIQFEQPSLDASSTKHAWNRGEPFRTKQQKHVLNVKVKFNKKKTFNRMQRAFTCDIFKSDVRVCCAVYLLIPPILATSEYGASLV